MQSKEWAFLLDLQRAELSICSGALSFLQSDFWGRFKASFGWEALAFSAVWKCAESSITKPLLVLRRPLAPGLSISYIPWGPELPPLPELPTETVADWRWAACNELALALRPLLGANTVFIRFDPPWFIENPLKSSSEPAELPPAPFLRSGADIQPPDTVLLDLTRPMEDIIADMKPKWRYNARLALKKGVTVRRAGAEEAGVFYSLLEETARRDGIAIHNIDYYRTLLEYGRQTNNSTIQNPQALPKTSLYLAEHEGDVLAGIVTLFRGREAVYLYGSSSDKKRSLMAPYALQLKAIEDAKEAGCVIYDLFGIPPDEDPSHPMAGLFRFKTGFGGSIVHRPGSWDYPCRPLIYSLFRRAETLRKNFRTLKKQRQRSE